MEMSHLVKFKTNPSDVDSSEKISRLKDGLSKHLKRKQIVEKFKNIEQRLRMLEEDG